MEVSKAFPTPKRATSTWRARTPTAKISSCSRFYTALLVFTQYASMQSQ